MEEQRTTRQWPLATLIAGATWRCLMAGALAATVLAAGVLLLQAASATT